MQLDTLKLLAYIVGTLLSTMLPYRTSFVSLKPTKVPCLFFFQAEDCIRVLTVTGVQTCALPIFRGRAGHPTVGRMPEFLAETYTPRGDGRSEERRVGKECRSRWSPDH